MQLSAQLALDCGLSSTVNTTGRAIEILEEIVGDDGYFRFKWLYDWLEAHPEVTP